MKIDQAGATCTDTIHRVRLRNGAKMEAIASAFLNSLIFAFAEIIGRSYGGGVLELEPREAERLLLPLKGFSHLNANQLNKLIVAGDVEGALDITDKVLLRDALGLSEREVKSLRAIWQKLRDRRINRK